MKPKVICHMISSVDGRILTERWTHPEGSRGQDTVSETYESVAKRLKGDAWIVGRRSMAPMTKGRPRDVAVSGADLRTTFIGDIHNRSLAIAVDPQGKLHYARSHMGDEHYVAILSKQVSDAYLEALRETGVSYLFAGNDGTDLSVALETLREDFAVETLLLEGGGTTNGWFLKAGLIDELSLLIYPAVDGLSGVPSVFEYAGSHDERPALNQPLRLLSSETVGDGVIWLRYAFEKHSA